MQCLGFPIKLRQFRFHLQGGVVFLQVDVQRLCFGYLHFVTVLEKREGEADYYSVEWSSGFRVPAIAEFQLREPLRFVDGDLLAGNEAFVVERHQGAVGRKHFRFQHLIVGGERRCGIRAFFENYGDVAVQCVQFLQFITQGGLIERSFRFDIQQFQIDFIRFQCVRISGLQAFSVHFGEFFRIAQPFLQNVLLLAEHNNVQAHLFRQQ